MVTLLKAGNYYINRGTTGAIVGRQPFGGVKASNFGAGFKAGGPPLHTPLFTYSGCRYATPRSEIELHPDCPTPVKRLIVRTIGDIRMDGPEKQFSWIAQMHLFSCSFHHEHANNLSQIKGQHNWYYWVPARKMFYRCQAADSPLDQARI